MSNFLIKALTTEFTEQDIISLVVDISKQHKDKLFNTAKSVEILNMLLSVSKIKYPNRNTKGIIINTLNNTKSKLIEVFK